MSRFIYKKLTFIILKSYDECHEESNHNYATCCGSQSQLITPHSETEKQNSKPQHFKKLAPVLPRESSDYMI